MTNITAGLVKELREKTGAGMMDCKKALTASNADIESAIDWLRKKGLSAAAKKAGRVASEGLVGLIANDMRAALLEVNAETDFVARNCDFQEAVKTIGAICLENHGDLDAVVSMKYPNTDRTISEQITHLVATIGENINIRRSATLEVSEGVIGKYIHSAVTPDLGRIGVIVGLQSTGNKDLLDKYGRQIAMHIAAANPQAISTNDLSSDLIEREREILLDQARQSGKPEEIIEKMVEGRLRKYYEDVVLLEQTWVIDGESKVSNILKEFSSELGCAINISSFYRFSLGEGIEKESKDFASEVAETLSS